MALTATIGTTVEEVLALVDELDEITYGLVDLRTHALRCVALALAAGADDALTTAALLHDIGRARYLAKAAPGVPHEEVGRRFVAERFGERAGWLVAAHVTARRYLAAVDPDYLAALPRPARSALKRQGGPLPGSKITRFESNSWAADAVTLRRWDDRAAHTPDLETAPTHEVAAVLRRAWIA